MKVKSRVKSGSSYAVGRYFKFVAIINPAYRAAHLR